MKKLLSKAIELFLSIGAFFFLALTFPIIYILDKLLEREEE